MPETTHHARPPILAPEIYQAVAVNAEKKPEAKLIAIHVPVANATVAGKAKDGAIELWTVIAPMSEDMTRVYLAGEVERGNATEDQIVFLKMAEVAPEHLKLN